MTDPYITSHLHDHNAFTCRPNDSVPLHYRQSVGSDWKQHHVGTCLAAISPTLDSKQDSPDSLR